MRNYMCNISRLSVFVLIILLWVSVCQAQTPAVRLQDEGVTQGFVDTLNCTGPWLDCTKSGGIGILNGSGGAGGYATIQDETTPLTQRATVNFTGAGVSCVDSGGATRTDCTITGTSGAPTTVPYWTGAADATLSAEHNLGALGTGFVINTAGTPSIYAGVTCTNQVLRILGASGAGTCVTIDSTYTSGTFPATAHNLLSSSHGDTLAASVVRGDILRGNTTPAWSRLALGGNNLYLKSNATDLVYSTLAAAGVGSCTNQFPRTLNADAVPTCGDVVPADFASQTANFVLAAPDGSAGDPTFRALVDADVPNTITIALAATATALAADPADCAANNFASSINASGTLGCSQPVLSTDTTGNYLASSTSGAGITGATTASHGGTITPAFDYTATLGANPAMNAGEARFSTTGIILEGATANLLETLITVTDPTVDRTFTIPDADSNPVIPDTGAANNFLTAISAGGVISKAQPDFSNLSGTATDGQVPNNITIDLATAASALAADPADCSGNNFALGIVASGVATCAQPAFTNLSGAATDAQVPDTITLTNITQITNRAISDTTGTLAISRGGTGQTTITTNQLYVGNGLDSLAAKTLPSCSNGTTSKLLYDNATQTFSCGVDQGGAGGSANVVEVSLNLGTEMGLYYSTTVAAPWVTATSSIACSPLGVTTDGQTPETVAVSGVIPTVSDRSAGVGFNLNVMNPNGGTGTYRFGCTGA